ncbi:MAG: MFS transporter [Erythrobacter sp.]|nr:MFS transporter [Erythrobacter sp.]
MQTRRNWPWLALIIIAGIGTVGFIDRIVVNVLVEPVKTEFHLTDLQVSLMAWAFALLQIGVGLVIARLAERFRRLTLISLGTVLWSIATALCGYAGSWAQLLVARMGVGLGEAIGLPSNQSVIADYFPASKRGLALSVLLLSPPVGAFIGFVGGGWIAQNVGWRETFLIAAIPGLLLGFAAWFFVGEPQRGQHDPQASDQVPPISAVFKRLFALPSARNMVIGSALAAMLGFGLNFFFASLMVREFGTGLAEAGLYAGLIASLPAALSVVASGWLGDRLGSRNPAAYALIPAFCMLVGGPFYAFAIWQRELPVLLALVCVATVLNFGYLGVTFAAIQNLMHPRMRATCSAILNGVYGVAGGLGPSLLGWMSDRLSLTHGPARGLAMAMAITGLAYLWASAHYFLAARRLPRDMEAVQQNPG